MRSRVPGILFAALLSGLLVIMGTLPALGYIRQPQARLFLSAPKVVKCNQAARVTGKVVDVRTGRPVRGQVVKWRLVLRQSSGDRIAPQTTKSNANGLTATRVTFGPKAGQRRVAASIRTSKPNINIRCAGGLPQTSVLPPADYVAPPPAALLDTAIEPPPEVSGLSLPVADLRVRRLGIDVQVMEGDGYRVPDEAVAHYPDTAWPGQGSNTYIYGHAREGQFLELWEIRTGDLVEMDMAGGEVAEYRVSEIHPLVDWDALEYLDDSETEILTLQTCLTYEETAPRFVVIAERIPSV